MSDITLQQKGDLAKDAYIVRTVTREGENPITIGDYKYKVVAVHRNAVTGYQGTVYQDIKTNKLIVAHRGTESLLDGIVDLAMVTKLINLQTADASKLTRMAITKAEEFHYKNPQLPKPSIIHTGHSLGGTHVEIQTHRYKHEGVTFNGYGAVGMHGTPKGGNSVVNYVKAADPVSAANDHHGKVVILAGQDDITLLRKSGYNNKHSISSLNTVRVAASSLNIHSSDNFVGKHSILLGNHFDQARQLAESNKNMIQNYRGDVASAKTIISASAILASTSIEQTLIFNNSSQRSKNSTPEILKGLPRSKSLFDNRPDPLFDNKMLDLIQNDDIILDGDKKIYITATPDITKPLAKNASSETFQNYAFTALMSDNQDKMLAAVDSFLDSNIGRNAMNKAIAVHEQKEMEELTHLNDTSRMLIG